MRAARQRKCFLSFLQTGGERVDGRPASPCWLRQENPLGRFVGPVAWSVGAVRPLLETQPSESFRTLGYRICEWEGDGFV